MGRLFPHNKMGYHSYSIFLGNTKWMEISSDGCEDCVLEWRLEKECLHVSTRRFCCEGTRTKIMQTHQIHIWPETSTVSMV
jgi:hypothetical protein